MADEASNVSILLAETGNAEHLENITDFLFVIAQDEGRAKEHDFNREALLNYVTFLDSTLGKGICSILAYRDGKPIGYISAMVMPPMSGMSYFMISFVILFWVLKEERGAHVGRSLIEGLRRWSANRKTEEIHLQVNSAVHPANTHKMLLSEGFHSYGVNYILKKPFHIVQTLPTDSDVRIVKVGADDDVSVIADLVVAAVKEGIHRNRKFNIKEYLAEMQTSLKRDVNRVLFIAKRGDKPIGYAIGNLEKGVSFQSFRFCQVGHFYIVPEETQAVEMSMVENIINWVKEKKAEEIGIFIFGSKRVVQIGEALKGAGFTLAGGNYVLPLEP